MNAGLYRELRESNKRFRTLIPFITLHGSALVKTGGGSAVSRI